MGCGQSRLSRRIQALPRPNLEGFIRICRSGSLRQPNLSQKTLLREDGLEPLEQLQEDDVKSTSFEAMPSPERASVKVTVAPHLEKEMYRDDHGFKGQETEQNVGSIAPLKGVSFKDEALIVKETPKTKEMEEEEEEEEEDKNKGIDEEDRWIGKSGSPSFRIYLPESIPSDGDDDDDDNVKDVDTNKTSPDEYRSTENTSSNEVSDASETKSGGKGRRFMESVKRRRLNMSSCCNASHQQPVPEQ